MTDGRCDCNGSGSCPLGRVASEMRCTTAELKTAADKYVAALRACRWTAQTFTGNPNLSLAIFNVCNEALPEVYR